MKTLHVLLLALSGLAMSCSSESVSASAAPARPEQWAGSNAEVTTPTTRAIDSAAAWDAAWKQAQRPKPRELNVAREQAVAVFIGERRTGGYSAEVTSAGEKNGRFVIEYRENTPPRDAMVTQALTAPWAIAVIPKTKLPIVFEKLPVPGQRQEK